MSHSALSQDAAPERGSKSATLLLALLSLTLCMLLSSLGTSIANIGLPTFTKVFTASVPQVQWIVLAYLLAITTLIVGAGRLGDMFGRRRLLLSGIVVFTLASALCAAAPTLWLLIAGRALQGVGAAMMMALSMAMVGETVAKSRTGSAMGLLGTMSATGTALGPTLGGILISSFGWQAIFLVQVPLGVLAFGLALRSLPSDPARKGANQDFDVLGMSLLALTLAAYALAVTLGRGSFGLQNAMLLGAAALGLVAFVTVEARAASPLLDLKLFRDALLSAGLVASLAVSAVLMTTLVVGPFYLSGALGLDAAWTGAVVSVGPIVVALSGVPAGRITDRFGAQRMTSTGLAGVGSGALLFAVMPQTFGIGGYIAALVVTTMGYAVFQTANNTAVMTSIPGERRGVISGMLNLSRNIGLVTGASVMGAIFAASAAALPGVAYPEQLAAGMRTTFLVAAIAIGAAYAVMVAGRLAARSRGGAA